MRKAKSNARMEETLRKIERKTNSEQKDENLRSGMNEDFGLQWRVFGMIYVKRRKSTEGRTSTVNANEVGNLGNGKNGIQERWLFGISNAEKRLKLEADEKDDGYYTKTADANEEAGAGSMVVF